MVNGKWNLTRRIDEGAPFYGTVAVDNSHPRKWYWKEHIKTPLPGGEFIEGEQYYIIQREANALTLYYGAGPNKNKIFQRFDLKRTPLISRHRCGEDVYETHMDVHSLSHIIVTHNVSGPRKAYKMVTEYLKL